MLSLDSMNNVTVPWIILLINLGRSARQAGLTVYLITGFYVWNGNHCLRKLQVRMSLFIQFLCFSDAASRERRWFKVKNPVIEFEWVRVGIYRAEERTEKNICWSERQHWKNSKSPFRRTRARQWSPSLPCPENRTRITTTHRIRFNSFIAIRYGMRLRCMIHILLSI